MDNRMISVIIPVYKVEKYLSECIESILNQTYSNLEIILVDDGSPDKSGEICDHYAKLDDRITVIHKQNQGVAMARNDGIERAQGAYISFVDSDDWMKTDAFEKMVDAMNTYDVDCVVGGCQVVYDRNGKLEFEQVEVLSPCSVSSNDMIKRLLLKGSAVWNRLFKREVFETIRFPQNRINDDEVVALHAYAECKAIYMLNETTYLYRIRENSITTSSFSLKKVDVYRNAKENMEFIDERIPALHKEAEYKYLFSMLYCLHNLKKILDDEKSREEYKNIKQEIKDNIKKYWSNPYIKLMYRMLATVYCI